MVCESFGGGVFSYLTQLCNDLCEMFDIYLAYSVRKQTPENYELLLDSKIHLIQMKNVSSKAVFSPIHFFRAVTELKEIANKVNPDIIHLHSSIAGGLGRIAFSNKNFRVIYTPHGFAHILLGNNIKSYFYYFIEKLLGNRALTLTCCESENVEAKKFSKNTYYIETGVNVSLLSSFVSDIKYNKNKKFTVFSLGRACVQKQPQIFNQIATLVPEADFIWIGGGELEKVLTAPNIKVTGWLSRKDALRIAMEADAFILCSLGEAIAMSLVENMFIKKLILVSNTIGNKSVIKNNVNGYVCSSAEAYAEHIKNAMREFPYTLTQNAYSDVMKIYNTEVMKKKFISFYKNLCTDKNLSINNFVMGGGVTLSCSNLEFSSEQSHFYLEVA